MSSVARKKGESFESYMRRVKQIWLRSGRIPQVRKIQYFERKKSKNVQQKQAVARAHQTSKTNYLRKIGKLPPEETTR